MPSTTGSAKIREEIVEGMLQLKAGTADETQFAVLSATTVTASLPIRKLLTAYDCVKEFGAGVDRFFADMSEAGLPEPVYKQKEFMLYATLKNKNFGGEKVTPKVTTKDVELILEF